MKSLILFATLLVLPASLMAQGKIAGKVQDAANGEPLIGCNVILSGTKYGASTDLDGNFIIFNVPEGTYSVDFMYISYQRKQVSSVHVTAGLTTTLHISLQPEAIEGDEIVVEATASRNQETGLLLVQKKSVKVMDGISSEQISKTSDGNAGAALKRVTGVSLVGGKDVYVRGLGNRYSNVQLNGSTIPSTNPNQKEAPMDIFSSNVVDNIIVQKTYTADQPGEFSGGSVQIFTKDFPQSQSIRFSVSTSYNSYSTGKDVLSYRGGSTDFLGFDDGTRKLPSVVNGGRMSESQGVNAIGAFQNVWTPNRKTSLPSQSYALSYGNVFGFGDEKQLGVVASASYNYSTNLRNETKGNIFQPESFSSLYDVERSTTTAMVSGMLNLYYKFDANNKIGVKNLYTNTADNSTSIVQGYHYNLPTLDTDYRQTVLKFVERRITSTNVTYDTYFKNFLDSKVLAEFSYSTARAYEPDTRNSHYVETAPNSDQFVTVLDLGQNYHFFSDQDDRDLNYRINWDLKATDKMRVKIGGLLMNKQRDFEGRRFVIANDLSNPYPDYLRNQTPEIAFADTNFGGGGLRFYESTRNSDSYGGVQDLRAGYVSSEYRLTPKIDLVVGARVENSVQKVNGQELINTTDVLPAINVTYRITDNQNVRGAVSKTLARPEFREISNFFWSDFLGGRVLYGNPDLKRTEIYNYDLRWETFPGIGEMISVSGFYKYLSNPIEIFHRATQQPEVEFGNVRSANLYGLEIEARKTIVDQLRVTGNLTLIASSVHYESGQASQQANKNRPMYGQSPYTINVNAFYTLKSGTEFSLAYNRFGKRISSVGSVNQEDDEYELPFDKLDLSIAQKIQKTTFKFNVQNLLNDKILMKQAGIVTNRYKIGITYSIGASYDF